jgi:spermidine/putrescine transport system substrate-binding protein
LKRAALAIMSFLIIILVLSFTLPTITGCKEITSKQLDIYVWEGYVPESVAALFEQETGIKLNINFIADSEKMLTLLKGGGKADIIMPTDPKINLFYEDDLVQPLDLKNITNYENVSKSLREQLWAKWDGNQMGSGEIYAVPYVFGTSGLILNTSKYTKSLDNIGWEVLFDKDYQGRVSSRNYITTVLLILDLLEIPRKSLVTDTQGTLEQIRDKTIALKDNVIKFYDTFAEIIDLMKNEEVWVSYIQDGQGRKLTQFDSKFKYILPKTGGMAWTDTFMIPKNAANTVSANLFINFMLRADVAATVIEQSGFNTTVKDALDMTKNIDKNFYRFTEAQMANFKWSPSFPEEVISAYTEFWEEMLIAK